jgi:DNA mismatch endonuclease (patch repair protein)
VNIGGGVNVYLCPHFRLSTGMTISVSEPTESTRRRMRRTRSRDNDFEREVRSAVFSYGLRYRVHFSVPGLPRRTCDIAFPRIRLAVFLDGCFWHGCQEHASAIKTNSAFWDAKIARNVERDLETDLRLKDQGWTVLRFWEHQDRQVVAATIIAAVRPPSRRNRLILNVHALDR